VGEKDVFFAGGGERETLLGRRKSPVERGRECAAARGGRPIAVKKGHPLGAGSKPQFAQEERRAAGHSMKGEENATPPRKSELLVKESKKHPPCVVKRGKKRGDAFSKEKKKK